MKLLAWTLLALAASSCGGAATTDVASTSVIDLAWPDYEPPKTQRPAHVPEETWLQGRMLVHSIAFDEEVEPWCGDWISDLDRLVQLGPDFRELVVETLESGHDGGLSDVLHRWDMPAEHLCTGACTRSW